MSYSYLFKFIIIGDSAVGKSCLLKRFIDKTFYKQFDTTIGVEFGAKFVSVKDKIIKLQLWDTAGQETFRAITKSYYRGAAGIILVYDITKHNSFDNLAFWINDIKAMNTTNVPTIIIGNKLDRDNERQVEKDELETFAISNGYLFKEISVKNDVNSGDIFIDLVEHILDKINAREIEVNEDNGIKTQPNYNNPPPITIVQLSKNNLHKCCNI